MALGSHSQPQNLYNPVPTTTPETATPGDYLSVRANPENMGAQVGAGLQRLGSASEEVGNKAIDFARFQQGIANETAVTNADAAFAMKVGQIKGQYMSLSGNAAYNAFPQYQKDLQSAFQEQRGLLPPGAQRSFDMLAARSMANHIADGSSYAASQLKEGLRDSYTNLANANMQALLDPNIASDPTRAKYHLDSLVYAANAGIDHDHPGLKTSDDGTVTFDDATPEGRNLRSSVQQRLDAYLTQGYVNQYDTLMKRDVRSAYSQYQDNRSGMPSGARVMLDAKFGSKIFDQNTQDATGNALQDGFHAHWDMLTNPGIASAIHQQESGGKPHDYQIQPGTFAEYAQPGEKFDNPADQDAVYKRIISDIQSSYPNDTARQAVAYFSGKGNVAPTGSPTPWVNDVADKNGKTVSSYVSDIQDRMGGKTYATGPSGSPMTSADYYMMHRQDVLARGDAYAEQMMPGDLALKRAVRQSLSNFMEATIQNQHLQYTMDNRNVMRAITGEMTNGKAPSTEMELRQIPNVSTLLDRVAYQDPKFYETIPTLIGKNASRNTTVNSANGYDAIQRSLEEYNGLNPNGIFSQDHLQRLLGRSDGTGINMKDYNDAAKAIELPDKFKRFVSQNMQSISTANGNLDGLGQQRAIAYYNSAIELYKQRSQNGKVLPEILQDKDLNNLNGNYMPSRAQQLQNLTARNKQGSLMTFASPDDPGFAQLPKGTQFVTSDGQLRIKN